MERWDTCTRVSGDYIEKTNLTSIPKDLVGVDADVYYISVFDGKRQAERERLLD